jgi:hypothetical protein
MEQIVRLALAAGTGAGMVGLRRWGKRLAWFIAVALAIGLLAATAIGYFCGAIWYAIDPKLGPAWASAITGAALAVSAGILWLSCRHWYLAPRHSNLPPSPSALLSAAALPEFDIPRLLERHATSVLLAAFVAGMLLNRRR